MLLYRDGRIHLFTTLMHCLKKAFLGKTNFLCVKSRTNFLSYLDSDFIMCLNK